MNLLLLPALDYKIKIFETSLFTDKKKQPLYQLLFLLEYLIVYGSATIFPFMVPKWPGKEQMKS
jgi:hypothetical protein